MWAISAVRENSSTPRSLWVKHERVRKSAHGSHTHKSVPPVLQRDVLQNNNTYNRFSLLIHSPAEPSAIRTLGWLKLIWSNVTICHACGSVPGLTHPFQALSLSDLCSPPPPRPSRASIFGHLYMVNIIHKPWDKRMRSHVHLLIHTVALTET